MIDTSGMVLLGVVRYADGSISYLPVKVDSEGRIILSAQLPADLEIALHAHDPTNPAVEEDSITIYGFDGTQIRRVSTNTLGEILVRDREQFRNEVRKIIVDLSVARTDALLIDNVIDISEITRTGGATYNLKFFSTTADAISETDLDVIKPITSLDRASIYITNTAQAGATATFIVLRKV